MTRPRSRLAAVILAAGQGTRLKSARAKVLHEVGGRPIVYYPVKRALEAGADPLVVVVGFQAEAVEEVLKKAFPGAPLRFAHQKEQLGTAHAVLTAKRALRDHKGPVLILYGDTPLITRRELELVLSAKAKRKAPLAFATMIHDPPLGYGRVVRDGRGRVQRIVEAKDASKDEILIREVNTGLYCIEKDFLFEGLKKVRSRNAQGEFYLTDLVELAAQGSKVQTVLVPPACAAGVNDRADLSFVGKALVARLSASFQEAGVTIEDPTRFDCDEGVEIERDVVIEPGVRLKGATRVGEGTRIAQGCILDNATIGKNVVLEAYTLVRDSRISDRAIVGPFARLRPGCDIGEGAHLGNFVETKKTRIGKGSKANHLSYLGDADIGAGVNVGAGTITCNYDGVAKYPTRIGDGAFIGSDSILVAPIEIGARAYVAAGSTLTERVPDGALALGRARQVLKEGWVAQKAQRLQESSAPSRSRPRQGVRPRTIRKAP